MIARGEFDAAVVALPNAEAPRTIVALAEAKKHAGISVLMASLRSPGVTIRPSMALYGKTFSAVFYDNVRVPAKCMVGPENGGWKVITDALAAERVERMADFSPSQKRTGLKCSSR